MDGIDPVSLFERFERLNDDECEVVLFALERIERGRETYGPLDLGSDSRDLEQEWLEEAVDGFMYATMKTIKMRRQRGG